MLIFQCVSDLRAKMVAKHFTTDEVIHFIMDRFLAVELKATKKTCLERRGILSFIQPMSVVVTVSIQKKMLKWMNPVHGWVVSVIVEEKMRCGSGCGGRGWGQQAQGAVEEQVGGNYILIIIISLI